MDKLYTNECPCGIDIRDRARPLEGQGCWPAGKNHALAIKNSE
jgi:hypothetical protein